MSDSVQLLKALADETRLRILNLLLQKELCVCKVVETLDIGQSKASRHLAVLKNAGLVKDRREGAWTHYSLTKPTDRLHSKIVEWLSESGDAVPSGSADLACLAALNAADNACVDQVVVEGIEEITAETAAGSTV